MIFQYLLPKLPQFPMSDELSTGVTSPWHSQAKYMLYKKIFGINQQHHLLFVSISPQRGPWSWIEHHPTNENKRRDRP